MKKIKIMIYTFLCISIQIQAQTPEIQPPSLTAQAFMRYGEIPVNYSTGVPNISIPLCTVKGKKLEIPISISYHASGIKVNDVASEVGLGWVLNCGGMVARTIIDKRDEAFDDVGIIYETAQDMYDELSGSFYYDQSCVCYPDLMNFETYLRTNYSETDNLSDRYYYSLPNGESGVFRFDFVTKELITLPKKPIKVEREISTSSDPDLLSVRITDENGIIYTFERFNPTQEYYTNATDFYLTRIETPDMSDYLDINYEISTSPTPIWTYTNTYLGPAEYPDIINSSPNCEIPASELLIPRISRPVSFSYEAPKISSIETPMSTVTFTYGSRTDFPGMHKLENIEIESKLDDNVLKNIQFSTTYFGSGNNERLKLDAVTITSPGITNPQTYTFQYDSQLLPDYPGKCEEPDRLYNEDFWGYFNNSFSTSLIPREFVPLEFRNDPLFNGDRDPNPFVSKACMLNEVKYPTGGRTVFNFERHYAEDVYPYKSNPDGFVGGFRVQSIINYDENNVVASTKTYEYANPYFRQVNPSLFKYFMEYIHASLTCPYSYTIDFIPSQPLVPLEAAPGLPIVYGTVTEYNGTLSNNSGKTEYLYNPPYSPNDEVAVETAYFQAIQPYHLDKGNFVPELKTKSEYSFKNQAYYLLDSTKYHYSKLYKQTFNTGITFTRLLEFGDINNFSPYYLDWINQYQVSLIFLDTKAFQESSLPTYTENYTYDPFDPTIFVYNRTDFQYESEYSKLTKTTTSTSIAGINKVTDLKYPFDYTGTAPYDDMITKNIISPIVEKTVSQGTACEKINTNYFNPSGSVYVPQNVQQTIGTATNTQITYNSYDANGNVQEYTTRDGIVTNIIWGYDKTYPVVKIIGNYPISINTTVRNNINSYLSLNSTETKIQIDEFISYTEGQLPTIFSSNNYQVTIYTYKPLIGMTSETDPAGLTTYYEYDNAGRLQFVRNPNGDLVKKFEYNYFSSTP